MPPEFQPLVEQLFGVLKSCEEVNKPSYKKKLNDAQKRLRNLFEQIARGEVSQEFIDGLQAIATALNVKDYQTAPESEKKVKKSKRVLS